MISKEVKNSIFGHNWTFRHPCTYKQSALTKSWNCNVLVQIWYGFFRYTGRFFLGCALLIAHCNISRASWETKKERLSHRKKYTGELAWGTSLFWLHAVFSMSLPVAFFIFSLPLPKEPTCWMAAIKIHNIVMVGILCDDIMSEQSKIR